MLNLQPLMARWSDTALEPWLRILDDQVTQGLSVERYGDLPRWRAAVASLPSIPVEQIDLRSAAVSVASSTAPGAGVLATLEAGLRALHPWRKGPYHLFGIDIDTEWRSDWKWDRLAPHIDALTDRRVLDVGCGNGYHCWRMRGAGAAEVVGVDPSPLFVMQFQALQRYLQDTRVAVLPLGIEAIPPGLNAFDTVFSMGVLYHRRSPLEHLQELRGTLRAGGQLVLETLVIEGDEDRCLVPEGRYARMGNVWFIPSSAMLLSWLRKLGWSNPRLIDETATTVQEQRGTPWMTFHSLSHFLDPSDARRTVEGYPAPRRATVLAEAPGSA